MQQGLSSWGNRSQHENQIRLYTKHINGEKLPSGPRPECEKTRFIYNIRVYIQEAFVTYPRRFYTVVYSQAFMWLLMLKSSEQSPRGKLSQKLHCNYEEAMTCGLEWFKTVVYFNRGVKTLQMISCQRKISPLSYKSLHWKREWAREVFKA